MNKYKNIIKLSNLLLDAVFELKQQRLRQIQGKFEEFGRTKSRKICDFHGAR